MQKPVYRFLTATCIIAFVATLLASIALLSGCQERQAITGKVPTVTLKNYSGETFTLAGEDKDVTLLVFWATWCQPCLMEVPTLVKMHEKYHSRNFRVVAINVDDPEGQKVKAIVKDFGINYPVLIGNEDVMKQFGGIVALPTSFLIGRDGRIREKLQGLQPEDELEHKVESALAPAG